MSRPSTWAFSVLKTIGSGAFSTVQLVKTEDGHRFALKRIQKSHVDSEEKRAQFLREIKIHAVLDHPNVVEYVDCFEEGDDICMLLEHCDHGTLDGLLVDLDRRGKTLPERHVLRIVRQVVIGLAYLHSRDVIHRDIKPGNVFLASGRGDAVVVKLGDFGFARVGAEGGSAMLCGTPNYIAPEAVTDGTYSSATDMWAVGVLTFTLLFGRPPFNAPTTRKILANVVRSPVPLPAPTSSTPSVSPDALAVIRDCLAHDPSRRPSAEQLLRRRVFRESRRQMN